MLVQALYKCLPTLSLLIPFCLTCSCLFHPEVARTAMTHNAAADSFMSF